MSADDEFYWRLARGFYAFTCLWAILGIITNSIILVTTVRTKALRSTCNLLIGVCAAADIIHQCGTLMQFPMIFNFDPTIDSGICSRIIFLPVMGVATGCICILSVGIDRLYSIVASIKYRTVDKRLYHSVLVSMMVAYCVYCAALMIKFYRPQRLTCAIASPFHDEAIFWFSLANVSITFVAVVVYFGAWLSLRLRKGRSDVMRRVGRSLFIVAAVDLSGWILTPGCFQVMIRLGVSGNKKFATEQFIVMFINVALAVKFFIYYTTSPVYVFFFSTDYRTAFKRILFGSKQKISQVSLTAMRNLNELTDDRKKSIDSRLDCM